MRFSTKGLLCVSLIGLGCLGEASVVDAFEADGSDLPLSTTRAAAWKKGPILPGEDGYLEGSPTMYNHGHGMAILKSGAGLGAAQYAGKCQTAFIHGFQAGRKSPPAQRRAVPRQDRVGKSACLNVPAMQGLSLREQYALRRLNPRCSWRRFLITTKSGKNVFANGITKLMNFLQLIASFLVPPNNELPGDKCCQKLLDKNSKWNPLALRECCTCAGEGSTVRKGKACPAGKGDVKGVRHTSARWWTKNTRLELGRWGIKSKENKEPRKCDTRKGKKRQNHGLALSADRVSDQELQRFGRSLEALLQVGSDESDSDQSDSTDESAARFVGKMKGKMSKIMSKAKGGLINKALKMVPKWMRGAVKTLLTSKGSWGAKIKIALRILLKQKAFRHKMRVSVIEPMFRKMSSYPQAGLDCFYKKVLVPILPHGGKLEAELLNTQPKTFSYDPPTNLIREEAKLRKKHCKKSVMDCFNDKAYMKKVYKINLESSLNQRDCFAQHMQATYLGRRKKEFLKHYYSKDRMSKPVFPPKSHRGPLQVMFNLKVNGDIRCAMRMKADLLMCSPYQQKPGTNNTNPLGRPSNRLCPTGKFLSSPISTSLAINKGLNGQSCKPWFIVLDKIARASFGFSAALLNNDNLGKTCTML